MTFKNTFCPSPWLHMRINNSGQYEYCRWSSKGKYQESGIAEESPLQYFQHGMAPIRQSILNGETLPGCAECYQVDSHGKVSGRQRQLLKIGSRLDDFTNTLKSSPWVGEFKRSQELTGYTKQTPQDWQIDLGNYCNSACVFCTPESSSRLATEFKRIGLIDNIPNANWCENNKYLDTFLDSLKQCTTLKYLHFIGGETIITPAFKKILETLIKENLHKTVAIGFTTNLTTWNQDVIDLLGQFETVHLGMSIECIHPLNDYVRYGSNINQTMEILEQWLSVAGKYNWYKQIRITPTVFTVWHLNTIYDYAYKNSIAVESCNFLNRPEFMRPSVLNKEMRDQVITRINDWINQQDYVAKDKVINTRNPNNAKQQTIEDAQSYINYLENQPSESFRLPALVEYIKLLETSRNNNILDYLPEYEELLRSSGY
jgi:hypothetical protein